MRALFPSLGVYEVENAIVNISSEIKRSFNDTLSSSAHLQSEINLIV